MCPPIFKSCVLETYEEIAEGVEERRQTPWADVIQFEKTLSPYQTVLDMGCGTGRNASHFSLAGHNVIGLDFSKKLLERAGRRIARTATGATVEFVLADMSELPLKDSSIDACIYIAALHHLPTAEQRLSSLREMKRCLKPGGRTLISVWAFEQKRFEKAIRAPRGKMNESGDIMVQIKARNGKSIPRFYHLFARGELEGLVRVSGLDLIRCFKSHDNYFAVAARPHDAR